MARSGFGIRTRILVGSGLLVALTVAVGAWNLLQLDRVAANATRQHAAAAQMIRLSGTATDVEAILRNLAAFQNQPAPALLNTLHRRQSAALDALNALALASRTPAHHAACRHMQSALLGLSAPVSHFASLTRLVVHQRADLQKRAGTLLGNVNDLQDKMNILGDPSQAAATGALKTAVVLLPVNTTEFLTGRDPRARIRVAMTVAQATGALNTLRRSDNATPFLPGIKLIGTALKGYAAAFQQTVIALADVDQLYGRTLLPTLTAVRAQDRDTVASLQRATARINARTQAAKRSAYRAAIGFMALAAVLGVVIAALLSRGVLRPIRAMTAAMGQLAAGDTGITIPSRAAGDEIGAMARAVEVFRTNALERARLEREQESERTRAAEERRTAMQGLAERFQAQIGHIVDGVGAASGALEGTATTMSRNADDTSRQAGAVAGASQQASANVQTVAAATEELSGSVSEVARQVQDGTRLAQTAVSEAERTHARVTHLSEAAQKISDVVRLINDIAGQTNLLALNATIEAARAGEAGKGFAVVASEVKNLATQTAKATEEIASQINGMQQATGGVVEAIGAIGRSIGAIAEITTTIAASVGEQGAATAEIARNIQQVAVGAGEISATIAAVTEATGETGAAATEVLTASQQLARQAATLREAVGVFIAEVKAA